MKKLLCISLLMHTLASCGYDRFGLEEPLYAPAEGLFANTDISTVQSLYGGTSVEIEYDMVISAYVTSSDRAGNFYRSLMVESGGRGIEVMAGLYDLSTIYPVGRMVYINLRGLTLGRENGVYQLGFKPAYSGSGYQTDYVNYRPLLDKYMVCSDSVIVPWPAAVTIAGLTEPLCGAFVEFGELTYTGEPGDTWGGDYRVFEDLTGGRIAVVTSPYADFASEPIPAGRVAVRGILQLVAPGSTSSPGSFAIKMRDTTDVTAQKR